MGGRGGSVNCWVSGVWASFLVGFLLRLVEVVQCGQTWAEHARLRGGRKRKTSPCRQWAVRVRKSFSSYHHHGTRREHDMSVTGRPVHPGGGSRQYSSQIIHSEPPHPLLQRQLTWRRRPRRTVKASGCFSAPDVTLRHNRSDMRVNALKWHN